MKTKEKQIKDVLENSSLLTMNMTDEALSKIESMITSDAGFTTAQLNIIEDIFNIIGEEISQNYADGYKDCQQEYESNLMEEK